MTEQQPKPPRRRKPRAPGREEIEALWASVMRDDTDAHSASISSQIRYLKKFDQQHL